MHLPQAIRAYFDADGGGEVGRLLQSFAADAVVKDEGAFHVGHLAIASWWRAAKARYGHKAEPLEAEAGGGTTRVRARVTGNFPGSPATLAFAFRLEGDRIARLEIGA